MMQEEEPLGLDTAITDYRIPRLAKIDKGIFSRIWSYFNSNDIDYVIHIRIKMARHLFTRKDYYTDACVRIKVMTGHKCSQTYMTKVVRQSQYPTWNEDFSLTMKEEDYILLEVVNFAGLTSTNVSGGIVIGHVTITLESLRDYGFEGRSGPYPILDKAGKDGFLGTLYCTTLMVSADEHSHDLVQGLELSKMARTELQPNYTLLQKRATLLSAIKMQESERKETKLKKLTVWCGSWNCGEVPPPDDMKPWVKEGHDIYVFGAQENTYAKWAGALQETLGDDYALVGETNINYLKNGKNLVYTKITAFIKKQHVAYTSNVFCDEKKTGGLNGAIGNKGGVAISFTVQDLVLGFVNSHLAAHQPKAKRRNKDVKDILGGVKFGPWQGDAIHNCHHVFYMGDLNYRVDYGDQGDEESPSPEQHAEMVGLVSEGNLDPLLKGDQLLREKKEGCVFYNWKEGDIKFRPTFKVKVGEDLTYNIKRSPAWCDRVLYRSNPQHEKNNIRLLEYDSCEQLLTSDHKPVYALFKVAPLDIASATDSQRGQCSILFYDIYGKGMIENKHSVLKFNASFIQKSADSSPYDTKRNEGNGRWAGEVCAVSSYNSPEALRSLHIVVSHTGETSITDVASKLGNNVHIIAQGLVSLKHAVGGEEQSFNTPLLSGGLPAGIVSGKFKIQWIFTGTHHDRKSNLSHIPRGTDFEQDFDELKQTDLIIGQMERATE